MTIASEINRIKTNIESAYVALHNKGASLPQNQNSANLVTTISSLDINDSANIINAINYTGHLLKKGDKVFITTINPNNSLEDGGYYIINFTDIVDDHIYTGVTADGCSALAKVDVFTVLESNVMTNAENDSFIYDVII
jgi:hypothetical protein